jgi:hypothetical protein
MENRGPRPMPMIAGMKTMVDETKQSSKTPCRQRRSKYNGRRHETVGEEIKTSAKRQKHWRRDKNICEETKTLAKTQIPSAKRQKHWRRHVADGGKTKPISEASPTMVGDDSYLID